MEYAKSFIDCVGEKRVQGLIKGSLADKGVPLKQYFVPFKAKLKSTNCDMMEGVIGTENDAIDIIKGTPAYKALKDYNASLVKEQQERLRLITNQFGPPSPRKSTVTDGSDDAISESSGDIMDCIVDDEQED